MAGYIVHVQALFALAQVADPGGKVAAFADQIGGSTGIQLAGTQFQLGQLKACAVCAGGADITQAGKAIIQYLHHRKLDHSASLGLDLDLQSGQALASGLITQDHSNLHGAASLGFQVQPVPGGGAGLVGIGDNRGGIHHFIFAQSQVLCWAVGQKTVNVGAHAGLHGPVLCSAAAGQLCGLHKAGGGTHGGSVCFQPGCIHFQPVPRQSGKPVDGHCFICHTPNSFAHPMLPFISRRIRLFISIAYSSGSSLETLSAKPLTIMARASSSGMPRLIR